jgi:methylenetetrahydrofolate dehydrogenase (NADP+)/methenyltetrahydrofolate cyclohydrolase
MSAAPPPGNEISGTDILRQVRAAYTPYRDLIAPQNKQVAIIRFEAAPDAPADWRRRMEASRVSAEQKVRAFSHLGYQPEHIVLPADISAASFRRLIDRCNQNPHISAVIVQFPPPSRLRGLVQDLAPEKDIDALLVKDSPHQACATADGVLRIAEPFTDQAAIAVVGAKGFVGQGVVRLLQARGHDPMQLDAGDDLTRVRDADIIISVTGQSGILGAEHLRPHHRLVIDTGFVPQGDGAVHGDVQAPARSIPQHITPVPGGIGPVEMAVLMERAVRKDVVPGLQAWRYPGVPYLTRAQVAARAPQQAGHTAGLDGAARLAFPTSTKDALRRPRTSVPSQTIPSKSVGRGPEQAQR